MQHRSQVPASFAQQRIWFWDQLHPGTAAYYIPTATQLKGDLDLRALTRALGAVVRRHESLRMSFAAADGRPIAWVIDEPGAVNLEVTDLSHLLVERRESEWETNWDREFTLSFNLERGPLWRARLVKLSRDEHRLLFNAHHIVYDMWSHGIFLRELSGAYGALVDGKEVAWPALSLQYSDYARRQHEMSSSGRISGDLAYWRDRLAGDVPPLQLPMDLAAGKVATFAGAMERRLVDAQLEWQLKEACRRHGLTPYMFLLASFAVLLRRYSGQTEFVIGVPVTHRDRVEWERVIGLFLNLLLLKFELADDLTVRGFLTQSRRSVLDAIDHQSAPFEKVVETINPERPMHGDPMCRVMFDFQVASPVRYEAGGVAFVPLETRSRTAKYDLTLLMKQTESGLMAQMEYNSGLFVASTVRRMLAHLERILGQMTMRDEARLSDLQLMDEPERWKSLHEWNGARSDYPQVTIGQAFEEQARRTPTAVALLWEEGEPDADLGEGPDWPSSGERKLEALTYAELNARADRIARRLRARGVGPEVRVALAIERSPEMMVGLLGIMKAGGAYVPVDPSYPEERMAYLIEDCGASVVLTTMNHEFMVRKLSGAAAVETVGMSESDSDDGTACAVPGNPEQLAYICYTSGSTGLPKGVEIPHRGVLRLVKNTNYFRVNSEDVFLQFAPLAFDASTFEIWAPLLNGGTLALMTPGTASLEQLGRALKRFKVTMLWLTSGLFQAMVDEQLELLSQVRTLLTGGDVVSPLHAKRFLERHPQVKLLNCYGPTENTTFSTWFELPRTLQPNRPVPIGTPVSNTQVYVLDSERDLAPIGLVGELYLGGDGLARGYLNAPEMSADRFVSNPFRDGERLYRTGDLARWSEEGYLEFIGRSDHQVKIRGFRVELGEIETVLRMHPGVRDAVVIAWKSGGGDQRLVAYWIPKMAPPAPVEPLREFLGQRVPDFMAPSHFVCMDAFPLSKNGKVDRSALPPVEETRPVGDKQFPAPRNSVEAKLEAIWREVLGLERVGVRDNFFALGGHSLLATRMISRISQALSIQVPLKVLFETRTIAALAEWISGRQPDMRRDPRRIPKRSERGAARSTAVL